RHLAEQQAALLEVHRRLAVLADARVADGAAERRRHRLHPVADAEHRDAELEQPGVDVRCARLVDRGRPSGQDDPRRVAGRHLGGGRIVRDDLGVDTALTHAPGDQLGVLRAHVDHQHGTVSVASGAHPAPQLGSARLVVADAQWLIPTACSRCSFLPSVWRAGANMISAFWKAWMLSYPVVAIDVRSAPIRLSVPSFSLAGPTTISSSVATCSVLTRAPRGSVGWNVAMPQW